MKIKNFAIFALVLIGAIAIPQAMTPTYTSNLVNETALAYSKTFTADLNTLQVDQLSFQAVYSSATLSNGNFNNGTASTGSVTVASISNLGLAKATDTISLGSTAALAAAAASDNVTVLSTTNLSGAILTVKGIRLIGGSDWQISTATGTAESIKSALNSVPGLVATRASSVVYATATATGSLGNSYTMSSSTPTALSVATPNFIGGLTQALTAAVLTVNGKAYVNGYLWKSADTSSGTATNIASFLSTISGIQAASVGAVVYATATTGGSAGNNFTLASSTPSAMTIGSANFINGYDSATVTINGVVLTAGNEWTIGVTTAATAKSISDAIVAKSSLNTLVSSTWNASALVTITALSAGPNYSLGAAPSASLTISGGHMTGGAGSAVDTTNDTISITTNGFTTSYQVLFSTLAGSTPPGGLTNQTTYYVIPVDANTIKLATGTASAQAGVAIDITSQGSTTGTFRFSPLGITGTSAWKWQESNDNTNWVDMNVSSVTFASPYTSTTTFWDFGQCNMRYVRLNFVAPTTGGVALTVKANGKRNP